MSTNVKVSAFKIHIANYTWSAIRIRKKENVLF